MLLLLVPASCQAYSPDPWTTADTKREFGFVALTAFDIFQTDLTIKNEGKEINPLVVAIVGEYPDSNDLVALGIGWSLFHATVSRLLPAKMRKAWQHVTFALTLRDVGISYGTKLIFRIH